MRLRPVNGLSLLPLKLIALVENNQPPISAGAIKANIKVRSKKGVTDKIPSTNVVNQTLGRRPVSMSRLRSIVKEETTICERLSIIEPPVISKKAAPSTIIMAIDISFERGTCPSSRDFSSFLAVGCSVFSWELSSAMVSLLPITNGSVGRLQTINFEYCP